jgi:hypothetical protein
MALYIKTLTRCEPDEQTAVAYDGDLLGIHTDQRGFNFVLQAKKVVTNQNQEKVTYKVRYYRTGDAAYDMTNRVIDKAASLKDTAWGQRNYNGRKMNAKVIDAIDEAMRKGNVYMINRLHGGEYNVDDNTMLIGTKSDDMNVIQGLIAHEGTHYFQDTVAGVDPRKAKSEYHAWAAQLAVENNEAYHLLTAKEIQKINQDYVFTGDADKIHDSLKKLE